MTTSRYLRARLRPAAVLVAIGVTLLGGCTSQVSGGSNQVGGGSPKVPEAALVYPLTGEPHANAIVAQRPPLSIKVDNVAGALPQAGLNRADLIVDTPVEGGLTRLFAVFQSQGADLVGPIRSARPVDATLLRLVGGGIFAYSGSSPLEIAPVKADSGATLLSWEAHPRLFFLRSDHVSPHTVFSSTALLYGAVKGTGPARQVFSYSTAAPSAPAARSVSLPFPLAPAGWTWDGGVYLRTQGDQPDLLVDGSRVSTANVVVLSVALASTNIHDSLGNDEPLPVVTGSGTCWVLRNGVVVHGTWHRADIGAPLRLVDGSGAVIPLHPGRTWIELLPHPATPTFG